MALLSHSLPDVPAPLPYAPALAAICARTHCHMRPHSIVQSANALLSLSLSGNKGDHARALKREQLIIALDLNKRTDNREIQLFACSLVEQWGFMEAFKWLAGVL
jgi:hypothetical protein